MKLEQATLRQFKALPISDDIEKCKIPFYAYKTTPYGFVLAVAVKDEVMDLCKKMIGLTPEQMNNTFHKSWSKVRDTDQGQLWQEQILHYLTTYGFKAMGIYNESTVFIPREKLKIPELTDNIMLTKIRGMNKAELRVDILKVLSTGIALKEETVKDYLIILKHVGIEHILLNNIKNKEMACLLCDEFDIIPDNATEFLRYVIYSVTGRTLLIKDEKTINELKLSRGNSIYKLFKKADLKVLATIFNRFKPLFLALKKNSKVAPYINKISKLSKKYHKPMPIDYLNYVTSLELDVDRLDIELEKANIFRKIRLLYALNIRLQDPKGLLYKIRNGKSFIKLFKSVNKRDLHIAYKIVLSSIVDSLDVKGKKVYIPKGINYTLPATEKQFTGEFPSGTSVTVDRDMVVGISWEDFEGNVDLDLSVISMDGKIGWNSVHKDENLTALFSGDIVDSSQGATEIFYISHGIKHPLLLINNLYSGSIKAPFKIFVAKMHPNDMDQDYTTEPNNILLKTSAEMSQKEKILGIIIPTKSGKIKFVLSESSSSRKVSSDNEISMILRDYLYEFYTSSISLKKVLKKAGAELVSQKEAEIDLSPEKVTKSDFINLLN